MTQEEYIQKYLNNKLSDSEAEAFMSRLSTDDTFKSEVDFQRNLIEAFKRSEAQKLKKELIVLSNTEEKKHHAKLFQKLIYVAVASALIIGFFYNIITVQSGPKLYADYFEVYPNTYKPVVRGNADNFEAFQAYENEDFAKAERLLHEMTSNKNNPNLRFYLAIAQLNQNKNKDALNNLMQLENIDYDYKAETYWYIALIHIKNENFNEAIPYLKFLESNPNKFKLEESKLLLQKIAKD